ncbi:MAG TPA: ornithine cyclodeaminase family protein [Bacillota bacterium]|nr:ornithine cyclodeaminase family protein [Bacillota bacterium]
MLYLNRQDVSSLIDFNELIEAIEHSMEIYDKKQFMQPDRIKVNVSDSETYLYMPCFTEQIKGTKILTLSQGNSKYNLPTIQGVMLLNDPKTGTIDCIIDGASITGYRTGAVGAAGIKYTSGENCRNLGIIGTGVQAFYQAQYAAAVRDIENIYLYNTTAGKMTDFAKRLKEKLPKVNIIPTVSPTELVKKADIIITATPSSTPVLPDDAALLEGKHYIGIGSYKPNMHEYPESIYKLLDKIYVDVDFAKEESGDLITPCEKGWFREDNIQTLYSAVKSNSINRNKTTFFKSVGMALFDIFVAGKIYKKALEQGIGQRINQ